MDQSYEPAREHGDERSQKEVFSDQAPPYRRHRSDQHGTLDAEVKDADPLGEKTACASQHQGRGETNARSKPIAQCSKATLHRPKPPLLPLPRAAISAPNAGFRRSQLR